ncbi:MAG: hypothetical protein JNM56_22810 [Planctomycetia bacterium]|nr:hypothetical protein [Planctomycetia bacterium]
MTDANVPSTPAPAAPAFTAAETEAFHDADRQAAKMVAGLMLTIFTLALLGYSLICFLALRGSS